MLGDFNNPELMREGHRSAVNNAKGQKLGNSYTHGLSFTEPREGANKQVLGVSNSSMPSPTAGLQKNLGG